MFVIIGVFVSALFMISKSKSKETGYDDIEEVLCPIEENWKYGYINNKGEIVVEPQYDCAYEFSEGLALAQKGEQWIYLNMQGEPVIELSRDVAKDYGAGFFSEGLARIQVDEKWGYINTNGNIEIEPQYIEAGDFSEGLATVCTVDGRYACVNTNGEIVYYMDSGLDILYAGDHLYYDGLVSVREEIESEAPFGEYIYGYLNKNGNSVIDLGTASDRDFSEGLAAIEYNGKWGYINTEGEIVIDTKYELAGDFSDGVAAVRLSGKDYLINHDGTIVLEGNDMYFLEDSWPEQAKVINGMIMAYDREQQDISYLIDLKGEKILTMNAELYVALLKVEDDEGVFVLKFVDPEAGGWYEAGAYVSPEGQVIWKNLD